MDSKEITIYEPNQRLKTGFFKTWVVMIRNIIESRELIYQLFRRDFLNQYKKSFFGIGWILISPIVGIASWVILNSTGVLTPGDVGVPYPVYVLLGSSIWGLFMGFYSSAAGTLGAGTGFINQVNFPHEALLVKQLLQQFIGFLITFLINILVFLIFGVIPAWQIIFFPLAILPILFLGSAIGLIISVISVVASDVAQIVGILLGFVFYITPIVYSSTTKSGILQKVVDINPLTYLVGGVRDLIIYGKINNFEQFILFSVISFILFLLSLRLFYVSEEKVIEKMI